MVGRLPRLSQSLETITNLGFANEKFQKALS